MLIKSLSMVLLVLVMTIHAGDLPDVESDRMIGRQTFPISHPSLSRYSLVFSIVLWSLYPLVITFPAEHFLTLNSCFGIFIAARYGLLTASGDDKISSALYYVSLQQLNSCISNSMLGLAREYVQYSGDSRAILNILCQGIYSQI